ncbi:MAG: hypothetical protein RIS35_671 [Pseudomonadota bacterium]|jgi:DNA-binding protein H-NS
MATYKELLAQRQQLDDQIEKARVAELNGAIAQVRDLVAQYDLKASDIFPVAGSRAPGRKARSSVPPKYRDSVTGKEWTGRGKPPKWIEGKDRSAFLIA